MPFTLRVLGAVDLRNEDGLDVASVLSQPKRLALLAYLSLAQPHGFVRRDRLLSLFWPESDTEHARDALNTAVRFLRRELGRDAILTRGETELGVAATRIATDVQALRWALDGHRYTDALAIYGGELLDGFHCDASSEFDEWLEQQRRDLRREAGEAARRAAESAESATNVTVAVTWARRAVELGDHDERSLCRLLEMLDRLGDRAGALAAYGRFAARMADELGAAPSPETQQLAHRIRERDRPVSSGGTPTPAEDAVAVATLPDAPPASIGHWEIEAVIARRHQSAVWRARDTRHGRVVAIKAMALLQADRHTLSRFLREIRITATLAHPHVLPMLDSGSEGGLVYLVTPYIAGGSLRQRLERGGALPPGEALRFAAEIADAIDYAHRSGIVHRDVTPDNVLLADGHALVSDFGVARAIAASSPEHPLFDSMPATIVGSPAYMAPEQKVPGKGVGQPADLFAWACVLVEMLTGTLARTASDRVDCSGLGSAPPALQALLAQCLDPSPFRRPASASILRRELAAII